VCEVELWFQDEARIGQKKQPDPGVGTNRQSAAAPKDLGFASAYVFGRGLPIGGQSGRVDHADLQYRRDDPSSPRDQQPSRQRWPMPW